MIARTMLGTGATAIVFAVSLVACSRSNGGRVTAFRDALASADASRWGAVTQAAPTCMAPTGERASLDCLARTATWFGAKAGFHADRPDDPSAAAVALLIARDGRGESAPPSEAWLFGLGQVAGPGADTLRLAVSQRMADSAPTLSRALTDDADARALMRAVAESVPGACETYARLGAGEDNDKLAPQMRTEHSPCVQKDLGRAEGPPEHGRYGAGSWRGAAGALALWKDVASALHAGVVKSEGASRATLEPRIAAIDSALAKVTPKQVPSAADVTPLMDEAHEAPNRAGDAGR